MYLLIFIWCSFYIMLFNFWFFFQLDKKKKEFGILLKIQLLLKKKSM